MSKERRKLLIATSLFDGIEESRIRYVLAILQDDDADPNYLIHDRGMAPIHMAIGHESKSFAMNVTTVLLQYGASPNVCSTEGMTPVHIASAWGRSRLLRLLLLNGGNPWLEDDEGKNAFHFAYEENHTNAIEILENFRLQDADKFDDWTDLCDPHPKFKITLDKVMLYNQDVLMQYQAVVPFAGHQRKSAGTQTSPRASEISQCTQTQPSQGAASTSALNRFNFVLSDIRNKVVSQVTLRKVSKRPLATRLSATLSSPSNGLSFLEELRQRQAAGLGRHTAQMCEVATETRLADDEVLVTVTPKRLRKDGNQDGDGNHIDYGNERQPNNHGNESALVNQGNKNHPNTYGNECQPCNHDKEWNHDSVCSYSKEYKSTDAGVVYDSTGAEQGGRDSAEFSAEQPSSSFETHLDAVFHEMEESAGADASNEESSCREDEPNSAELEDSRLPVPPLDLRALGDVSNCSVRDTDEAFACDMNRISSGNQLPTPQMVTARTFHTPQVHRPSLSARDTDEAFVRDMNRVSSGDQLASPQMVKTRTFNTPQVRRRGDESNDVHVMWRNVSDAAESSPSFFSCRDESGAVVRETLPDESTEDVETRGHEVSVEASGFVPISAEPENNLISEDEEDYELAQSRDNTKLQSPSLPLKVAEDDSVVILESSGGQLAQTDCGEDVVMEPASEPEERQCLGSPDYGPLVSASEEYVYTDEEEGVVLLERRFLVGPTTASDSSAESLPSGYDTDAIHEELKRHGCKHGPIVPSTKRVYLKKLQRLARNKSGQEADQTIVYSPELERSIREAEWESNLSRYEALEREMAAPFAAVDPRSCWREGVIKSSFCYLLLDPRISCNLPCRISTTPRHQAWTTFLESIFYVGKGKRSRPYSHLYQAVGVWKSGGRATDAKTQQIADIWAAGLGVVCLHVFQNVIPAEAYTREAAMLSALTLPHVCNARRSEFYGVAATWSPKQRNMLGTLLLHKAMCIFLSEGERQLRPDSHFLNSSLPSPDAPRED